MDDNICQGEVFSGLRPEVIYPHQVLIHHQIGIISALNADINKLNEISGMKRVTI